MKHVRPDKPDPIAGRSEPQRFGTILLRFVVLLAIATVILVIAWSR